VELESVTPNETSDALVIKGAKGVESVDITGKYKIECFAADGTLKWENEYDNLVTTAGKNDLLDKYLAGSSYTAAWYLGIISATSFSAVAAADTSSSHSGWVEFQGYSQATRVAPSFSAASAGSKATSAAAVFSITAANTITGTFLMSISTKGGTTGVLYSAGAFTGGNKTIASSDIVNITYTASA
jgi:hypothetical protein